MASSYKYVPKRPESIRIGNITIPPGGSTFSSAHPILDEYVGSLLDVYLDGTKDNSVQVTHKAQYLAGKSHQGGTLK